MDMTALTGIAKSRWWILVAAALLAVYVTGRLADYQSDNEITNEAVTSITFVEDPSNLNRGDFEQFLSEQSLLAEDANSDLLDETPGPFLPWKLAEIHLVNDQNMIIFIGRGYTQAEADEMATALRDTYLSVSTVGAGRDRLSQQLDNLTLNIKDLNQKIAEEQTTALPSPEETTQAATRTAVETQIGSLQARYGALTVELMNPVDRSATAVQNEMDRVLQEIINLQLKLRDLPQPDDPTVPAVPNEQLVLDQLKLSNLQATWTQIYTQLRDLEGLSTVGPVLDQPPTVNVTSTRYNQVLALGGALVIAMLAIVAIERTRGIVWSPAELKGDAPVLTELPPRQLQTFKRPTTEPWYVTVPTGRRKAAVQLIRSQLDVLQNAVVAFQGTGVFDDDTLDLSADVAMSAAVSGRNVLLIDATFSNRTRQVEYGDGQPGSTLMGFFQEMSDDPETAMAEMKTALLAKPESQHIVRALRSGVGAIDAGDALASHRFEMLLDVAREHYDLVVMAGAVFGDPTSHILAQRVDEVVLVGSIGHTIDRQVEAAERDFKARRAHLLGIVMLRRRRGRFGRSFGTWARSGLWRLIDWLGSGGEGKERQLTDQAPAGTETLTKERKPTRAERKAAKARRKQESEAMTSVDVETVEEDEDAELASEDVFLEEEQVVDVATLESPDGSEPAPEDSSSDESRGIKDWFRPSRDSKANVRTGFQASLDRFGVTDPHNLSPDRYDPDGLFSEESGDGATSDPVVEGESGGDD